MLDKMSYRICETQAELYEYAAIHGFAFPRFSDDYLASGLCKRSMDSTYSRLQLQCPEEILDFLLPECTSLIENEVAEADRLDGGVAYWIGFTYRQMAFETGFSSKQLLDIYSFDKMLAMYPGMHTQDPEYVSEVLLEGLKQKGLLN